MEGSSTSDNSGFVSAVEMVQGADVAGDLFLRNDVSATNVALGIVPDGNGRPMPKTGRVSGNYSGIQRLPIDVIQIINTFSRGLDIKLIRRSELIADSFYTGLHRSTKVVLVRDLSTKKPLAAIAYYLTIPPYRISYDKSKLIKHICKVLSGFRQIELMNYIFFVCSCVVRFMVSQAVKFKRLAMTIALILEPIYLKD